jgi:hypothetical protein
MGRPRWRLRRVLKPGGQILMFEHVRSGIGPLGILMDLMTPLFRRIGPDRHASLSGRVAQSQRVADHGDG